MNKSVIIITDTKSLKGNLESSYFTKTLDTVNKELFQKELGMK